jgi:hypothetical protein
MPMALDGSYNGLKASIADFLNRGDLTSVIPDFIVLAEAQMARRFVSRAKQGMDIPRRLVKRADTAFALGAEYVPVPSDIMGPLELMLTAVPPIELDYLENANLQHEKNLACRIGAPKYYSVVGGELQIYPAADQDYAAELTYVSRVAALSDTAPGNWILEDYPDVYLYGALVQSAPYLKDDSRLQLWGTLFTAAIDDICSSDPMPTDKSKLRTEIALLRRCAGTYNINTDS